MTNGINKQSGQLLLEILIVVVVMAAITALGAELVLVGQKSNKLTGDKDTALKLVEEVSEAVRGIATENWQFVYRPPDGAGDPITGKGSGNLYHAIQSSGKWVLTTGNEVVTINGVDYTKSLYIENVNRDSSKNIVLTGGADDPGTQKIVVSVSWSGGDTVTGSEYITRWRGKGCVQTDWSGGAGGAESICATNSYDTNDPSVDTTDGSIKLQGAGVMGMLAYDEDAANLTPPHYRTWDGADLSGESNMLDEETTTEEVTHTIIEASPIRNEFIRGALTSIGHLDVQVWDIATNAWINGTGAPTNGEFTTAIGATNSAQRGFDVAYENISGDGLVVYESTSTANKTIMYRTLVNKIWSAEQTLNYSAVAEGGANAVAGWIELERDPGSDNILLAWQDRSQLGYYGARWDGSAWQDIALINGAGVNIQRQGFDVAWEGVSGEGMIAYTTGTTTDFSTYTISSGWTDGAGSVNISDAGVWLVLGGSPQNDYIAMAVVNNLNTSTADLDVDMWNGSDWTTIAAPTADTDINTYGFAKAVDVEWEQAAGSDRALFVWRDGTTSETSLRWMVFDVSVGQFLAIDDNDICNLASNQQVTSLVSSEGSNGPCSDLGTWGGTVSGIDLAADPNSRKIMLLAQNQRQIQQNFWIRPEAQLWNGLDTGTWFTQTTNMGTFETDASIGVFPSASLPSKPYDFAFTIVVSGSLTSVVFNTNVVNPAYNSIVWIGTLPLNTMARFKIAASSLPTGPWDDLNFIGSDGISCGSAYWYEPVGPDIPLELGCVSNLNDKQYFKYKVQLCFSSLCDIPGVETPIVTGVIVNWSP